MRSPVAYRLWASVRLGHLEIGFGLGCLIQFSVLVVGGVLLRLVLYCFGY